MKILGVLASENIYPFRHSAPDAESHEYSEGMQIKAAISGGLRIWSAVSGGLQIRAAITGGLRIWSAIAANTLSRWNSWVRFVLVIFALLLIEPSAYALVDEHGDTANSAIVMSDTVCSEYEFQNWLSTSENNEIKASDTVFSEYDFQDWLNASENNTIKASDAVCSEYELQDWLSTSENTTIKANDTVFSEQELQNWLSANKDAGGIVLLGDTITITSSLLVQNYSATVTIDTERFGLVFDGGYLFFLGDALIIGEGMDVPVVDAKDLGRLWIGDWSNSLRTLNITATGRNGAGGVALRISSSGSGSFDLTDIFEFDTGLIKSFGAGAVGLELTKPFSAYCFNISVEGEASAAVSASNGALLSFCKLTARGEGATAAQGNNIVLDTCIVTPEPSGEDIRNYTRTLSTAYLPFKQGGAFRNLSFDLTRTYAPLEGNADGSSITGIPVNWDEDIWMGIDLDTIGKTIVPGSFVFVDWTTGEELASWYASFLPLITKSCGLQIIVDVRDPDVPCISDVWFNDDEDTVVLKLWETDAWTTDQCILWRSDDDGETWYNDTYSTDVVFDGFSVNYPISSITEKGCLVQVEVPGVGESNIKRLSLFEGQPFGNHGGDRTGVDRKIGVKPGTEPDDTDHDDNPPVSSSKRKNNTSTNKQDEPTDLTNSEKDASTESNANSDNTAAANDITNTAIFEPTVGTIIADDLADTVAIMNLKTGGDRKSIKPANNGDKDLSNQFSDSDEDANEAGEVVQPKGTKQQQHPLLEADSPEDSTEILKKESGIVSDESLPIAVGAATAITKSGVNTPIWIAVSVLIVLVATYIGLRIHARKVKQ